MEVGFALELRGLATESFSSGRRLMRAQALLPVTRMNVTHLSGAAWIAILVVVPACGGGGDLPAGWTQARRLQVNDSQCIGAPSAEPSRLALTPQDGGRVGVQFRTTLLRCGQEACAYLLDQGNSTKLLVQPCEMHPAIVNKCACTTEVSFELDPWQDRTAVELWLRPDDYGHTGPNNPQLVDTATLKPTCGGENPSRRCRKSPADCLPSTCACSEGAWICTADCGGGRLCTDAGASEETAPKPHQ